MRAIAQCTVLFNLNAGEPKRSRNVSERLIGKDTIGKLSGLHTLHVLSFIIDVECRYVEAGRVS